MARRRLTPAQRRAANRRAGALNRVRLNASDRRNINLIGRAGSRGGRSTFALAPGSRGGRTTGDRLK